MGKVTEAAASRSTTTTTTSATTTATAPKVPTSEQIRMAQLLVDPKSEDHSSLKDKVHKVMELTRCDESAAFIALHDCDNDVEQAVVTLLEGGEQHQDEWVVQEGKKAKKSHQHQLNSTEDGFQNDGSENLGGKTNRRQRGGGGGGGMGNRGGENAASTDGPPRFRGRSNGPGATRGMFNKENDSRGDFGGGERGGLSKGRGRGGDNNIISDRGGRGRGAGFRGGRRGGGGFNQNEGGGGGLAQIDSWNAPPAPDNNTWDNSMANTNTVSNGPAGEWGKRKNARDNNTWDNSMAANASHTDYDWGGEEDYSKLRDGMVIEPSAANNKGPEKPTVQTAAAPPPPQAVSSSPVPQPAEVSRVRGESIPVNSLFGPSQPPATPQSVPSPPNAWSASKQATVDLKNELGIGKPVAPVIAEAPSQPQFKESSLPKMISAKVELPARSGASGPIDVQFGDMTLGAESAHGLFEFSSPVYQQQNNAATPQANDQPLPQRPQQQAPYQRAAGDDHQNGSDLANSTRGSSVTLPKGDSNSTSYAGAGSYGTQQMDQQLVQPNAQQPKPLHQAPQQQQQQQQFNNRMQNVNQMGSSVPQRTTNSGTSAVGVDHQRSHYGNSGPNQQQQQSNTDSMSAQQYQRDENFMQQMGLVNTSSSNSLSKSQVSTGATMSQPMAAQYQQAMAGMLPYMIDQAGLNYLQLYNTGGYDLRTVNSMGGANMGVGRDTGDMKSHMMRQDNTPAPSVSGAGNLNMPPPGLPNPSVSTAEAAAAIMAAQMMFPGYQFNYPPSGSPYMPQFYVPNVTAASAPTSGNQYARSSGGYQQAPQLFGNGYEELQQQLAAQSDYGKTNYNVMLQQSQGKPATSTGGGNMNMGSNDVGTKYGAQMKGPYDSKQYAPATATQSPVMSNMNYTQTATAPAHYGYSNYMPMMSMNMMAGPAVPSNAQMQNDLLNQRNVNQNGKPPGGSGGGGSKGMTQQQYQYATPWGN